jgi:hypothetical protein
MLRVGICVLLLSITACAADVTIPKVSLSGTWAYNAPSLSDDKGGSCTWTNMALGLTQSGEVLTGITSNSTFSCSPSSSVNFLSTVIVNGRAHADSVQFDIGTDDAHIEGTVVGDAMSGVTAFRIHLASGAVILRGPFTAIRHQIRRTDTCRRRDRWVFTASERHRPIACHRTLLCNRNRRS